MKFHLAGALAALATITGIATSPAVLGVLPTKYAAILVAVGVIAQAITKGVQMGGTDLVPKTPEPKS